MLHPQRKHPEGQGLLRDAVRLMLWSAVLSPWAWWLWVDSMLGCWGVRVQILQLDADSRWVRALDGTEYMPGLVGLNNMKANDYVNVVIQARSLPRPRPGPALSRPAMPHSALSPSGQAGCTAAGGQPGLHIGGWTSGWPVLTSPLPGSLRAGAAAGAAAARFLPAAGELCSLHVRPGATVWRAGTQDLEPTKLQGPGAGPASPSHVLPLLALCFACAMHRVPEAFSLKKHVLGVRWVGCNYWRGFVWWQVHAEGSW